ncbi:MAG: restriction endonuclease subunit S [Rugosibacter sp.]|nr:restriction endonuclease subunit S [Rugosibacter sp.]
MSELWKLPTTWCWTPIGDATDVIGGGTPSTTNPKNFEGSIPWITPADMSGYSNKTISGGTRFISEKGLDDSGARWLPQGTVLFSSRAPIGYVAIASRPVTTNQGFKSFVPESGLNSDYLYYWLTSAKQHAEALASGTTFLELSGAKAALIPLPLAPAAEQTRIVAKLEELLSDLDAGVAELKAAQKKLGQYRQSLLKAAVEGALTAEWRAAQKVGAGDTAPETGAQLLARILTERRARWEAKQLAKFAAQGKPPPKDWQNKYPEPVQPDTTDLPELPEGWVWASGEQLCEFITKGTTPPKDLNPDGHKTIPFLRVTNLTDRGELDMADEVFVSAETHRGFLARSAVYPNDVLMNIVGPPLGQVAVVPSTFAESNINQAIAIFRAVDGVLPSFICRYLLSPVAQQWLKARSKTTAGQTNLTLEVCRSLPFPLLPQDEQQSLIVNIEMAMNAIVSQEHSIDLSLKQSTAQRQNILRAAFAGQLVPQDPNDEPASVLLERIRKERAAQATPGKRTRRRQVEIA